jgi:NADPH:quinone reductase-like Zn-dependent oxidoreductase
MSFAVVVKPGQQLVVEARARPVCAEGHVIIRSEAVGLNRHDVLQLSATLGAAHDVLGLELAGVVVESRSERLQVGQRVAALVAHGAMASFVAAEAAHCIVLPDSMSSVTGAAVVESFATATLALELANVALTADAEGKRVLIHAGASALGLALLSLLAACPQHQIVATASSEKLAACRQWGAHNVLDRATNWGEHLGARTVDAIVDCIGADYYAANARVLKVDGTLVFLGLLGGAKVDVDLRLHLLARHQLKFSVLSTRSSEFKSALLARMWAHCAPLIASGVIKVAVHTTVPLHEAQRAFEMCRENKNIGKIVMTVTS